MAEFRLPELPDLDESRVNPKEQEKSVVIIPTVQRIDMSFAPGILVRDDRWQLAKVVNFKMVSDKTRYGRDDLSIRRPKKLVNPLITIQYPDGQESQIDIDTPLLAVYAKMFTAEIREQEPYFDESHLELRGHNYQLGELVSFGSQVGTLAIIYPDGQKVAISAREIWGKETPRHLYQVDASEIDYIERANGDIKKNLDGTIFKPTLR